MTKRSSILSCRSLVDIERTGGFNRKKPIGGYVRYLLCLVLVMIMVLLAWLSLRQRSGSGITSESFEKIEKGMTIENVIEIIGEPPGIHITMPFKASSNPGRSIKYPLDSTEVHPALKTWANDEACIDVYFNENGKVVNRGWAMSSFGVDRALRPTMWKRLRLFLAKLRHYPSRT